MSHLNPDFPYPAGHKPAEPNPARALQNVFEASDRWELNAWTDSALVTARAALRHMLGKVENELGNRKFMTPLRNRNS